MRPRLSGFPLLAFLTLQVACSLGEFDRTDFACPCDDGTPCVSGRCVPDETDGGPDGATMDSGPLRDSGEDSSVDAADVAENDGAPPGDGGPVDADAEDARDAGPVCDLDGLIVHYGPVFPGDGVWANAAPGGGEDGTCARCPEDGAAGYARFGSQWAAVVSTPAFGDEGGTIMFDADPDDDEVESSFLSLITEDSCGPAHNIFQIEVERDGTLVAFVGYCTEMRLKLELDDPFIRRHWAFTWGPGSDPALYINGTLAMTWTGEDRDTRFVEYTRDDDLRVILGGDINADAPEVLNYRGEIGHVRMFNRPLDPCAVRHFYGIDVR